MENMTSLNTKSINSHGFCLISSSKFVYMNKIEIVQAVAMNYAGISIVNSEKILIKNAIVKDSIAHKS